MVIIIRGDIMSSKYLKDAKGYFSLVLHAHLPFVRHPEYADFLEEDWLYEAITETYLPLVDVFDKMIDENIDFRITMSITPSLCAMLSDELLIDRYKDYLHKRLELSEKEIERTKDNSAQNATARMYNEKYKRYRYIFEEKYNSFILNAFKKFQDMGKLEIITCGATHGFFPLMIQEKSIEAQVKVACDEYKRFFGRAPRGIWLPECAYKKGVDRILRDNGINFFFLDTHGLMFGEPCPEHGVYSPILCPETEVAVFSRDMETSRQVWSKEVGYPGDARYREFYRDLGYDGEYDYIKPYLHSDGVARNIGLKYYKITGSNIDLQDKQEYYPQDAREAASDHAGNFMFNREKQIEHLNKELGRKPIVVATYDAELFGHWWFEGPDFIENFFRKVYYDQNVFELITPSEYLEKEKEIQVVMPADSSWGDKGYYEVWLNGTNDWIYRHLHKTTDRMIELANKYKHHDLDSLKNRALNQAARELLLAQSSDWAFIMANGTMTEYAVKRTNDHVSRFLKLADFIETNNIDEKLLMDYELKDNIFPYLDFRVYS
jgi:1,4-alpha-glucan branching enzyme